MGRSLRNVEKSLNSFKGILKNRENVLVLPIGKQWAWDSRKWKPEGHLVMSGEEILE